MNSSTIQNFVLGDVSAFKQIYDEYWRLIYKISIEYLQDSLEAEEAVQDIFARLWQYRDSIEPDQGVKGYLIKITYSILMRFVEKKKRLGKVVHLEDNMQVGNPTMQLLEYEELYETTQQAIDLLPERRKIIFRMSREQHMTHEEIAQSLGISKKTVENQIGEALKFLRAKLKPHRFAVFLIFVHLFM